MSTTDEVRRLGSLVRRVRGPIAPPHPGQEVDLGHLSWNLNWLRSGLLAVLPRDHPIHQKAYIADEPGRDPLPVWREVAAMPWEVVEDIIWAVQKQNALWYFETREQG